MEIDSNLLRSFAANVDWVYAGMIHSVKSDLDPGQEKGLAGKLLYADELEGAGSVLVVAANIAGASALTATSNIATQLQATRDGVINFLLPSVSDALGILKVESRQADAVAICVTQPPHVVEHEMAALGLLPDLLPPGALSMCRFERFIDRGARKINPVSAGENQTILTWSVDRQPAKWLPKLDELALECLGSYETLRGCPDLDSWSARRWLRHAPRCLGSLARGMRLLRCPTEVARSFLNRVREMTTSGLLDVAVEVNLSCRGEFERHRLSQPA